MPDDISLFSLIQWSPLHALIPLTILQRLFELRAAKKNELALRKKGAIEYGRDHYPAIVAVHALWFIGMIVEIVALSRPINPFWIGLLAIFLAAQGLRFWTRRTLGNRWTTRVLVLPGEQPIQSGPFQYLRHPNYLAVVAELLTLPLMFSCYVTAVTISVVNGALLTIRIRTEDRAWKENRAGIDMEPR